MINGIRLATQAGEGGARVRERVYANAEPSHAVTAGDAHQAESKNDRQRDRNGFAGDGSAAGEGSGSNEEEVNGSEKR